MKHPIEIKEVVLDGDSLTIEQVVAVARYYARVEISPRALERVQHCRAWVDRVLTEKNLVVYGLNTGFGSKANVRIPNEQAELLSRNLIVSHAAGVGDFYEIEVTRAIMLLRINTLVKGFSGIKLETVVTLVEMLNRRVHPAIPKRGSVGASGDLAPLSHLALVISRHPQPEQDLESDSGLVIGDDGAAISGMKAMARAGLQRIVLGAKEGLALNNGTQVMTALAVFCLFDGYKLLQTSEIAASMTIEAVMGARDAYSELIHQVRPYHGQQASAENIRIMTAGSELMDSFPGKVQDAYSIRCTPQVLGAVRDTFNFVRHIVTIELNAANDNPLIFIDAERENKAFSGGNFHGQPIAMAMDYLGIALAEIGSISERRTFRLTDATLNFDLPSFLVKESGLNSGFMIAQYTAASLVAENKVLAHPASVDSIPTSEDQEDHVSMGLTAALHATDIMHNSQTIVAIELMCAAQALDFRISGINFLPEIENELIIRKPKQVSSKKPGQAVQAAHHLIREVISPLERDRVMAAEIQQMIALVKSERLLTEIAARLNIHLN